MVPQGNILARLLLPNRRVDQPVASLWPVLRLCRCSRHLHRRPSAIPGLLVGLYLEPIHQLVEATEQVHDSHQLQYGCIIQPQLLHRRSVHLQSVRAALYR